MRELVIDAWCMCVPKRVAAAYRDDLPLPGSGPADRIVGLRRHAQPVGDQTAPASDHTSSSPSRPTWYLPSALV
ncbi:MAG: hypothetical protein ACLQB1_09500, partial [Streptosporangiaceae bacterium]